MLLPTFAHETFDRLVFVGLYRLALPVRFSNCWLPMYNGRRRSGSGWPIEGTPTRGEKKLSRIQVALGLSADKAEARLLVEAFRVEHLEETDIACAIAQASEAKRGLGGIEGMLLGF